MKSYFHDGDCFIFAELKGHEHLIDDVYIINTPTRLQIKVINFT